MLLGLTICILSATSASRPTDSLQDAALRLDEKGAYQAALAEANAVNALGDLRTQKRLAADQAEKSHRESREANDEFARKRLQRAHGSTRTLILKQHGQSNAAADAARERSEAAVARGVPALEQLQSAAVSFAQAGVHAEYGQMRKAYAAYRSGLRGFTAGIRPKRGASLDFVLIGPARVTAEGHASALAALLAADPIATAVILEDCRREIGLLAEAITEAGALARGACAEGFTTALRGAAVKLAERGRPIDILLHESPASRPASMPAKRARGGLTD